MKSTAISIVIAGALIGGAILFSGISSSGASGSAPANNVHVEGGKQIVEISVRGGYRPQKSLAKAGIPTVLRFNTSNTYDCSGSIRIPSLGVNKILPSTGATDIELGSRVASTLQGTCGMGMYSFEVDFQS